jgi:RimJ/RimL family protein N-acetyltransferase
MATKVEGYPKKVYLKGGTLVTIRPLEPKDEVKLKEFFLSLPEEDRLFLREDVTKPEVVENFIRNLNYDVVFPLVAEYEDRIVGDATLHMSPYGWSRHVGQIRMVVARDFQKKGLGGHFARLLVQHAMNIGLDKLMAEVVENQTGARKAFEKLGFVVEAKLKGHVKDIHGMKRDLLILSNDCSHIWESMESSMLDYNPSAGE